MIIAIDFDSTVVKHKFPLVGEDCPGAVDVLKDLVAAGHKLVLNTMRSNKVFPIDPALKDMGIHGAPNEYLQHAVDWFKDKGIPLYGVNKNPEQLAWTSSPKVYAELYIDDAALGCPLVYSEMDDKGTVTQLDRPYVNWDLVRKYLVARNILPRKQQ